MAGFFEGLKSVLFTADGKLVAVRALIALGLTGTACYLWVEDGTVPSELLAFIGPILGFYFGARFSGSS